MILLCPIRGKMVLLNPRRGKIKNIPGAYLVAGQDGCHGVLHLSIAGVEGAAGEVRTHLEGHHVLRGGLVFQGRQSAAVHDEGLGTIGSGREEGLLLQLRIILPDALQVLLLGHVGLEAAQPIEVPQEPLRHQLGPHLGAYEIRGTLQGLGFRV